MSKLVQTSYAPGLNTSCLHSDSCYAQFVLELDSQDTVAAHKGKTSSVASEEIETYEQQIQKIQEETEHSERLIADLKKDLAAAQQTRRNKIIYDAIAREALKLPSRSTSAECVFCVSKPQKLAKLVPAEPYNGSQQSFAISKPSSKSMQSHGLAVKKHLVRLSRVSRNLANESKKRNLSKNVKTLCEMMIYRTSLRNRERIVVQRIPTQVCMSEKLSIQVRRLLNLRL